MLDTDTKVAGESQLLRGSDGFRGIGAIGQEQK